MFWSMMCEIDSGQAQLSNIHTVHRITVWSHNHRNVALPKGLSGVTLGNTAKRGIKVRYTYNSLHAMLHFSMTVQSPRYRYIIYCTRDMRCIACGQWLQGWPTVSQHPHLQQGIFSLCCMVFCFLVFVFTNAVICGPSRRIA